MDLGKDTNDVVGVIVVCKGKTLMVKGRGEKWSLPKGRRREKETFLQGAIREAREEAGIDLSGISPDLTLQLRFGTYYVFNFWRTPCLKEPSTPEEVMEVGWHNSQTFGQQDANADLKFYLQRPVTYSYSKKINQ